MVSHRALNGSFNFNFFHINIFHFQSCQLTHLHTTPQPHQPHNMSRLLPVGVLVISWLAYYYYNNYNSISIRHSSNIATPEGTNLDPSFRRHQIESIILDSWRDYRSNGWDHDIYRPLNPATSKNMPSDGKPLGWIIVDAMDTLLYVDSLTTDPAVKAEVNHELEAITKWCAETLDYDIDAEVNIFETTIRMLGGLLSSYHLIESGNSTLDASIFLNKAIDLADRLIPAFNQTETGIPYSSINLHTGQSVKNHVDMGASSTAEFTTLQLEFKYLSIITGDDKYWKLVESVYEPLYKNNDLLASYKGLVPIHTFPDTGKFYGENVRFGSRADSFYEYLLKQYLLTREEIYHDLYHKSITSMKRYLLKRSRPSHMYYIAERPTGINEIHSAKMDHLVCFMGGLMAMGATEGLPVEQARTMSWWDNIKESDFMIAQELTHTCYQMYAQTPSGLAPEIVVFKDPASIEFKEFNSTDSDWWFSPSGDFAIKPADAHNLQRPETVESLMIMYHLTKDPKYRQWGAEILDSFIKNSCINCDDPDKITYTSLHNVLDVPTDKKDNVESFWMAETLKYLYLLFQDDVDLTKEVFNTEAHPFPVVSPERLQELNLSTGWSA